MISIIDYKMGNLASLKNAFTKLNIPAKIITSKNEIEEADSLILPGVGAYPDAIEHLMENSLDEAIKEYAKSNRPLLGICLGMQLLFERSYEFGETKGLGLLDGEVVKFDKKAMNKEEKIPHMGWNKIFLKKESNLFDNVDNPYLYFVHSYHVVCDKNVTIGTTEYGYEFTSAVNSGNVYGFQPHPEKSHIDGLKILENFNKIRI
ncbi:MAG: imidazole glycerol phosphate synthase subunit HisH [Campylobacterales bacterium]